MKSCITIENENRILSYQGNIQIVACLQCHVSRAEELCVFRRFTMEDCVAKDGFEVR